MLRMITLTAALVLFALPGVGCGQSEKSRNTTMDNQATFNANLEWLEGPRVEDYSTARLTITDSNGAVPVTVTDVSFEPMMPTHGHGSFMDDQQIIPTEGMPHVFTVKGIYFTMKGTGPDHWVINIAATVDGLRRMVQIPVDVP